METLAVQLPDDFLEALAQRLAVLLGGQPAAPPSDGAGASTPTTCFPKATSGEVSASEAAVYSSTC